MSILHKIKAWLYDNPFTQDPNDFVARVIAKHRLNVRASTSTSTKVDPSDIATNNPAELVIFTPELAVGSYKLQVVMQFTGNVLLKGPRTVLLDKVLTVQ